MSEFYLDHPKQGERDDRWAPDTTTEISKATAARAGKPQPYRGFIKRFPRAILAVAKVSMYGTVKHEVALDDMSYLTVPDADYMFAEAECRHLLKEAIFGPVDTETGYKDQGDDIILHKAEKAWNAMADLERALLRGEG